MMEDSRTQRLQQLLKRLGQAVHGSVVQSKDVQSCLEELHGDGWQALMLLEASVVCRISGELESEEASVRIHVDPDMAKISYRIDAQDVSWLKSLGISPDRHRSSANRRKHDKSDRQDR